MPAGVPVSDSARNAQTLESPSRSRAVSDTFAFVTLGGFGALSSAISSKTSVATRSLSSFAALRILIRNFRQQLLCHSSEFRISLSAHDPGCGFAFRILDVSSCAIIHQHSDEFLLAAFLQQAMKRRHLLRVLEIHVRSEFQQLFRGGEAAPLDRKEKRGGILSNRVDFGSTRDQQTNRGRVVVVGCGPHTVLGNRSS